MNYNQEHKAVELYDPRCISKFCNSNKKLPQYLTNDVDKTKGELCVTMDQLKKRRVRISCLHSQNMYKSVLPIKKKLQTSSFDKNNSLIFDVCKVVVRRTSTFMVNLFSYTH